MPPTIELIARGLLVVSNHVLLCRNPKKKYCYLPGGHIEFGESAPTALARELLEETGQRVIVGDLLNIAEFSFKTRKRTHHELNLTFHMELAAKPGRGGTTSRGARTRSKLSTTLPAHAHPDGASLPKITSREDWIEFIWAPTDKLKTLDLRPQPTMDWLATNPWLAAKPASSAELARANVTWQPLS